MQTMATSTASVQLVITSDQAFLTIFNAEFKTDFNAVNSHLLGQQGASVLKLDGYRTAYDLVLKEKQTEIKQHSCIKYKK